MTDLLLYNQSFLTGYQSFLIENQSLLTDWKARSQSMIEVIKNYMTDSDSGNKLK